MISILVDDKTLSVESVYHTLHYGILGKMLNILIAEHNIRRRLLKAHLKLKETAEKRNLLGQANTALYKPTIISPTSQ